VFSTRHTRSGAAGSVEVAFTDRLGGLSPPPSDSLDLGGRGPGGTDVLRANLDLVTRSLHVSDVALMRQVHGSLVRYAAEPTDPIPTCDALVTDVADLALCARAADCVPVALADPDAGVAAVVHAGRQGVVAGVVDAAVHAMTGLGAATIEAWIGPHICGGCYEVPPQLRAEVAAVSPSAYACTTWGTASLDLGAAVSAQLIEAGCAVNDVSRCTRESDDLHSYRRDGDAAGRGAGLVVLRSMR
jgi:polyphenol oxidase